MKNAPPVKKAIPFPFIVDELASLRPTIKKVFGFTHVYLGEKLLFSLRDNPKQTGTNGMWLYTVAENIDSLAKEFPDLPRRQLWRSGKNCWIVLAARFECFEEYALKACELILNGDQRIGRVTRGGITSGRYVGKSDWLEMESKGRTK
ncbi:MAG: hypothetical protein M3539_10215 [Acidobacteriota bacterium]|nr:hypothetical protein [Acidobacteriota bacterium]